MDLRLQILLDEELMAEGSLGPGPHAVGSGADATFLLPARGCPDLLCRLVVRDGMPVTVHALGEGDVETSAGARAASAPLRRGDFVRVGGYKLLLFEQPGPPPVPYVRRARTMAPTAEAAVAAPAARGPLVAHVRVTGGSTMEPIVGPLLIVGRAPKSCGIVVPFDSISVEHCHFEERRDGFWVVDRGSTNGTWVNGHRVSASQVKPGDVVALGPQQDAPQLFLMTPEDAAARPPDDDPAARILGRSPKIEKVKAFCRRYGPLDDTVLIQGETGTGKQLCAEALSLARDGLDGLLTFDCGAQAENLVESELFGHVKGAFTGAVRDRAGIFERAAGKTVFLDEIGELSLHLQTRLLRVIQEGLVRRVGGDRDLRVHARIVAATHRDLARMKAEGSFREDLFFRLNVLPIAMPALRDRPGDLELLARAILGGLRGAQEKMRLSDAALERLERHLWPGNVRELQQVLKHAAANVDGKLIDAKDIVLSVEEDEAAPLRPIEAETAAREKASCEEALRRSRGNVSAAARLLELTESKLRRKLRRLGIVP